MFYNKIIEKLRKGYRHSCYYDRFKNSLINMFAYATDAQVPFEFFYNLESYLIKEGEAGVYMENGVLIATSAERVNGLDPYGKGKDLLCVTKNGKSKTFPNFLENNEVVYVRNNYSSMPDLEVDRYSTFLSEISKSLLHNVINCRVSPIIQASTTAEKAQIERALENNENGKVQTIVGHINPLGENEPENKVFSYTDPSNIDKVQYLTNLHENIERWFFSMYGLSTAGSTKMAQQSVDEVNMAENIARILPDVKMEMRRKMCDEIAEKFGITITVEFNDAWKVERADSTLNEDTTQLDGEEALTDEDTDGQEQTVEDSEGQEGAVVDAVVEEVVEEIVEALEDAVSDEPAEDEEGKEGEE